MSNHMEDSTGVLSSIKLSESQNNIFLDYLRKQYNLEVFDIVDLFFENDLFLFLDIFSGMVFRVPRRKEIIKICDYIKIYCFIGALGFTDEAYQKAHIYFKKHVDSLKRIVARVKEVLARKPEYLLEEMNNPDPEAFRTKVKHKIKRFKSIKNL